MFVVALLIPTSQELFFSETAITKRYGRTLPLKTGRLGMRIYLCMYYIGQMKMRLFGRWVMLEWNVCPVVEVDLWVLSCIRVVVPCGTKYVDIYIHPVFWCLHSSTVLSVRYRCNHFWQTRNSTYDSEWILAEAILRLRHYYYNHLCQGSLLLLHDEGLHQLFFPTLHTIQPRLAGMIGSMIVQPLSKLFFNESLNQCLA